MATSGSYNFQVTQAEIIIREAYERIGILGDLLVAQQLDSATRSINFLLTEWSNRNVNLWTLDRFFIPLVGGVKSYTLPIQVQKVIQVELRTSIRQLNGTPVSSLPLINGGNVNNAFNSSNIPSTQNGPDGNISYDYGMANGVQQVINFVGIQVNSPVTYKLFIEASNDNLNWFTLLNLGVFNFTVGSIDWFELNNILPFSIYRIRVSGAGALDVQQIYFNNTIIDTTVSPVSRYEYFSYPIKSQIGRPTIYYIDYQITPIMYLWQVPSPVYNCLFYSAQFTIQTLQSYTEQIAIPSVFYQPLIWGLAWMLAVKYNPSLAEGLKAEYQQSMQLAVVENSEEVPFSISVYE